MRKSKNKEKLNFRKRDHKNSKLPRRGSRNYVDGCQLWVLID